MNSVKEVKIGKSHKINNEGQQKIVKKTKNSKDIKVEKPWYDNKKVILGVSMLCIVLGISLGTAAYNLGWLR